MGNEGILNLTGFAAHTLLHSLYVKPYDGRRLRDDIGRIFPMVLILVKINKRCIL